jgi:hypothetical protein
MKATIYVVDTNSPSINYLSRHRYPHHVSFFTRCKYSKTIYRNISILHICQMRQSSSSGGTVEPERVHDVTVAPYVAPTFRAKDVADVYTVILDSQFTSRDVSFCDKSRELCDWLEDNFQECVLRDLSRHPTVLRDLIMQLTEYQFETEDATGSILAYELRCALEEIAEELDMYVTRNTHIWNTKL